jgi:hypothetical protein
MRKASERSWSGKKKGEKKFKERLSLKPEPVLGCEVEVARGGMYLSRSPAWPKFRTRFRR